MLRPRGTGPAALAALACGALVTTAGCAEIFGLDPTERRDGAGPPGDGAGDAPRVDAGLPTSCLALHVADPDLPSGRYTIDPGGGPIDVACDMTTTGGGWTIVYAATGADNQVPMTSNDVVAGDPLAGEHANLGVDAKVRIAAAATESLLLRGADAWLVVDVPLFDANLAVPGSHTHVPVTISSVDGVTATGFWGYANLNIIDGGDVHLTMEDGTTCNGETVMGVDHHSDRFYHLNCGCARHYLYSYSAGASDGDAGYDVAVGLGAWALSDGCNSGEGGAIAFYAAMR